MKNMKIKLKLLVSFLTVAALSAVVGAVGVFGMAQLEAADTALYEDNLLAVNAMGNINDATTSMRMHLRNLIIYNTADEEYINSDKRLDELATELKGFIAQYEATIEDTADQQRFDQILSLYNDYMLNGVIPAVRGPASRNDHDGAQAAMGLTATQIEQMNTLISDSMEYNASIAAEAVADNSSLFKTLTTISVAVIVFAVAVAIGLGLYIAGLISKPITTLTAFMNKAGTMGDISLSPEDEKSIDEMGRVKDEVGQCISSTGKFVEHLSEISAELQKVAGGDLTAHVTQLSASDTMGVSLNQMIDNLNSMFSDIRSASDQVSSGAGQVSQGAQELASGSSQQAASIEELSASISGLQEKTDNNAADSAKAREANNKTAKGLDDSIRSMSQMLDAMKEIDESSSNITKVIKVIDDIAFQTNILALNAAVEAARAGQHGKGFAVVADEVRNLAAKSAEAAKETSSLIEGSTERVREGNEIVAKTNANLETAVESSKESTRLIEQVASASIEQAQTITEINQGVEQISTVVQANSATAEQSAAASEEMSAQAVLMNDIVGRFKLKQQGFQRSAPTTNRSGMSRHSESSSYASAGSKY